MHFDRRPMSHGAVSTTLNYAKIKGDLASAPERKRALLLQALRWVRVRLFKIPWFFDPASRFFLSRFFFSSAVIMVVIDVTV